MRFFHPFQSHHRGHDRNCIGRGRGRGDHGHGFGFFGGRGGGRHGFDGSGESGGGEFGRGRKLGSDDLQLLLLALLDAAPSHGYELIRQLEERSNGYYVPSPGMVYPALTFLEEIGDASVEHDGARKRYSLTEQGRARLQRERGRIDELLGQLAIIGRRMDDVRDAMRASEGPASRELHDARHALRDALRARRGASLDEERRIAKILERAADEIGAQGAKA